MSCTHKADFLLCPGLQCLFFTYLFLCVWQVSKQVLTLHMVTREQCHQNALMEKLVNNIPSWRLQSNPNKFTGHTIIEITVSLLSGSTNTFLLHGIRRVTQTCSVAENKNKQKKCRHV